MKNNFLKSLLLLSALSLVSACDGFFDKDNTLPPSALTQYAFEIHPHLIWSTSANSGLGKSYLKMVPAINAANIFTFDASGKVNATDKTTGKNRWVNATHLSLTAGIGINHQAIFLGSNKGEIIALSTLDGSQLWLKQLAGEILAAPTATDTTVIVKMSNGEITAFNAMNGEELWHYRQEEPGIILRNGSSPIIYNQFVIMGFANGNVVKLSLLTGKLIWETSVATPQGASLLHRMIDIDTTPVIKQNHLYVATYQGQLVGVNLSDGQVDWSHDLSSYSGLIADNQTIYTSDASGYVWAFDRSSGKQKWKQSQLENRLLSAPAEVEQYLVVGDSQGFVHWLSKQDGHLISRIKIANAAINAAPIVENNKVYILTTDGNLAAYALP